MTGSVTAFGQDWPAPSTTTGRTGGNDLAAYSRTSSDQLELGLAIGPTRVLREPATDESTRHETLVHVIEPIGPIEPVDPIHALETTDLSGQFERRFAAGRIRKFERGESWVDAVVTLVATVVFGLGWTLVELERAESTEDRYAAAQSVRGESFGEHQIPRAESPLEQPRDRADPAARRTTRAAESGSDAGQVPEWRTQRTDGAWRRSRR